MAPTLPRVGCRVRASPVRVHNRARAAPSRSVTLYDLSDQIVDYCSAWAWQKAYASALASEREQASRRDQALIILQHEPTYTLGTGSSLEHVKFDPEDPPHPLFRTERGGEVTFHGPGQLTVYPIVDLREHGADLHLYMRALEQIAIDALHAVSDIDAHRIEGLTGVWTERGKIAAAGIRATRWVSYHGVALNVCPDLANFDAIVPCGIKDRTVTSVEQHLHSASQAGPHEPRTQQSRARRCADVRGGALRGEADSLTGLQRSALLREYCDAIVTAFEGQFGMTVGDTRHALTVEAPAAEAAAMRR